ncbi:nucleotide exchange factor GrpE [Candidatus Saccharibacteria bacterium]|nr:nucleotide exchange factor GrpE [Candidatus Saccharibacteria bacterium]
MFNMDGMGAKGGFGAAQKKIKKNEVEMQGRGEKMQSGTMETGNANANANANGALALQKKLKETEETLAITTAKVEEMTADAQRARADLENYRKQVEKRLEKAEKDERDKTVIKILPLVDDMGRAIETYPDELSALKKNFQKILEKLELVRIVPEVGTEFDPEIHNAISVEDGDGEKEVIAETLQAGYMYEGEMLRPAMVRVKKI